MSTPAEANRTALDRLKSAIKAKRLADESLVRSNSILEFTSRAIIDGSLACYSIFQAQMELSIANLESNYLRETSATGNIIKVGC
jgi:hypothetical protein